MADDYYRELVKILRKHGCHRVEGGKGSHEKWVSPISGHTIIVPRSKSRHTANSVLKAAGLKERF